jgi:hypothetical protein
MRLIGLLDGILGGPKYTPAPVPLDGVIGRWTAARTASGLSVAGGEVVLTTSYLVFTPWDMTQTRDFLIKLLSGVGVPHVGDINKLLTASKLLEPIAIPLSQIANVQPLGRASLLKPPYARIDFAGGRYLDIGILASPRYPNFAQANNAAFDDWLTRLNEARAHPV